ncbi:MAG TPA: glycosyltransferase [Rhabdochlamydiaceae bacterium]|nr:glycosyltransferase [Rhabdochlamydiaceae bacterium]
MNIFVIPSWYPSTSKCIKGIFFKEQALAIGKQRPEWNVGICLWWPDRYQMALRKFFLWPYIFHRYWFSRKRVPLSKNVIEYHTPVLEWSRRFVSESKQFERAYLAIKRNLTQFQAEFGKVDLIHAHVGSPAGLFASQLKRELGIPYVITEHYGPFPPEHFLDENSALKNEIQGAYQNASAVLSVSPAHAAKMTSMGVSSVQIVPNCINEEFFQSKGKHEGKKTFFCLATRLCPEKGIDDLLHAAKVFFQNRPNFTLRIGGEGDLNAYRKMAPLPQIEFLGPLTREQVLNEMQSCSCFILPSHQESFGVSYAEALAVGKPVIATRCGGGEYVVQEDQGILVPVKSPDLIADAMMQMSSRFNSYDEKKIRAACLARFSTKAVVDQLETIYRSVQL